MDCTISLVLDYLIQAFGRTVRTTESPDLETGDAGIFKTGPVSGVNIR